MKRADPNTLFCLDLFDFDEMFDLEDHASHAGIVDLLNRATDLAKTKSFKGATLIVLLADRALDLSDAESLLSVRH